MQGHLPNQQQRSVLYQTLAEILNPREPLYQLANQIPWEEFEQEFRGLYSDHGCPAKPIRLMVGLHILKWLYDRGDETVVADWVQNPYWQYFCGEREFQWKFPVEPSDLVHFRKRIGECGVEKILQVSVKLHGKRAQEATVVIDTTVQEKDITFPTDAKLHRKVIERCWGIAEAEELPLRQSYRRTVKRLVRTQGQRLTKRNAKLIRGARRKLRTIGGRLVRELRRKLRPEAPEAYQEQLALFERVLAQQREDKDKIYSLHEPQVYCISKGKEHKPYEFGSKVSLAMTKNSGVIIGVANMEKNVYDGGTLRAVLRSCKRLCGRLPQLALADKGFRGQKTVYGTKIVTPGKPGKDRSAAEKARYRLWFRRRAAIEPLIGHVKHDFRLGRNYLSGSIGDAMNLMLAAAAWNFKKLLRKLRFIFFYILWLLKNGKVWLLNHPQPCLIAR